jgi:hypothetical protein
VERRKWGGKVRKGGSEEMRKEDGFMGRKQGDGMREGMR